MPTTFVKADQLEAVFLLHLVQPEEEIDAFKKAMTSLMEGWSGETFEVILDGENTRIIFRQKPWDEPKQPGDGVYGGDLTRWENYIHMAWKIAAFGVYKNVPLHEVQFAESLTVRELQCFLPRGLEIDWKNKDLVAKLRKCLGHPLRFRFLERLDYLASWGKPDTRCMLGWDSAPLSFGFTWARPNGGIVSGGLIYSGPDEIDPNYTVTLEPTPGWGVHT